MIWLEEKYINLLSSRLKLFKRQKFQTYSFRCPICGDSKKHAYKTRGSFFVPPSSQHYRMGCFNCGATLSFTAFLKLIDPYLHSEYQLEKYRCMIAPIAIQPIVEVAQTTNHSQLLSGLQCVSDLSPDHPAVQYLSRRKIDSAKWSRLYFVAKYGEWAKKQNQSLPTTLKEHARLIIPFFDKRGNITRISARAFFDEQPKYLYTKVKSDASRVYGLDTVNPSSTVYVLEGPLDSLFFDNAIATGSSSLIVPELQAYSSVILVPDNQPRNIEVCRAIKRMVDSGHKICLWNKYLGKDVNEAVLNGHSMESVLQCINASVVSGIQAQLKFSQWVKCKL